MHLGTFYIPQSLEYLAETCTSLWFCCSCSPTEAFLSYFLLWFQTVEVFATSRPYSLLCITLSWFFFGWLFFLCFCFILPASRHHLSLSALFWHIFSHSHSSLSVHVDDPSDPSVVCICALSGSGSTGWWSALLLWMQFISQITIVHATTCSSSWVLSSVLPLFQSVVLIKDKRPQKCICFPFAVA